MRILEEYGVNKGDGSMDAKIYRKIACTSGEMAGIDTSKLADGTRLTATDTGASYVFDESAQTWTQESSGGGSGGGGGGFKVTVEWTSETTGTSDKTSTEILDAAIGGSVPFVILTRDGVARGVLPLSSAMQAQAIFGFVMVASSSVTQTAVFIDSNGNAIIGNNEFTNQPNE